MGLEEQGDGVGVPVGALQQMGGHLVKRSGMVDGGMMGRSLQFLERGQRTSIKDRQVYRW